MTLKIEIGQKVHANFGAMYPIVEGLIVDISIMGVVTWATEDGKEYNHMYDVFRQPGETTVNGSPIGVYLGEY